MAFKKRDALISAVIDGICSETSKGDFKWNYYNEDIFFEFDVDEEDNDFDEVNFDFRKKHLKQNYKHKGIQIDKIKVEKSIYAKKTLGDTNLRVSIIKCKKKVSENDDNRDILLLICDFDNSDTYDNIAESDSFPQVIDLYDLSIFVNSKEIQEMMNCFVKR